MGSRTGAVPVGVTTAAVPRDCWGLRSGSSRATAIRSALGAVSPGEVDQKVSLSACVTAPACGSVNSSNTVGGLSLTSLDSADDVIGRCTLHFPGCVVFVSARGLRHCRLEPAAVTAEEGGSGGTVVVPAACGVVAVGWRCCAVVVAECVAACNGFSLTASTAPSAGLCGSIRGCLPAGVWRSTVPAPPLASWIDPTGEIPVVLRGRVIAIRLEHPTVG